MGRSSTSQETRPGRLGERARQLEAQSEPEPEPEPDEEVSSSEDSGCGSFGCLVAAGVVFFIVSNC